VDIRATTTRATNEEGGRMPVRQGEGSGFIIRSDGYIMTNDHVVGGADKVKVTMKDGREYDGKVIRAQDSDIAIVKIEAKDLPALAFGDSSKLRPGQMCMAVGAPFGLTNSVTFGHISALGRVSNIPDMSLELQGRRYPDMIQTDAAINMGNSGGPLLNVDGQVVGVNTAIYSPTGVSAGIGFAIPSNQAKFIGDMLIQDGKITKAMIGVLPETIKEYEKKDLGITGGARVSGFPDGVDSPAKKAGLKEGDIIVRIGSTNVNSEIDLRNAMLIYKAGAKVPVEVVRDGKRQTLDVTLGEFKAPKIEAPKALSTPKGLDRGDIFKRFKDFDGSEEDLFKEFRKQFQDERDNTVPRLREGKAQLGVSVGNVTEAIRTERNIPGGVEGAYVTDVLEGSVASQYGIKVGDVITEFNGKKITSSDDLVREINKTSWGDTRSIKFARYGKNSVVQQQLELKFK
jgi:serine protease Do